MQPLRRSILSHRAAFAPVGSVNPLYAPARAGWGAFVGLSDDGHERRRRDIPGMLNVLDAQLARVGLAAVPAPFISRGAASCVCSPSDGG